MITRRHFTALTTLALSTCTVAAAPGKTRDALPEQIAARLRAIEHAGGGPLGVHILDTASGAEFGHRADERFLMCSTFKLLAAACVLKRAELGQESLARRIVVKRSDLLPHSPVTEKRVGGAGMTLAELCHATITTSDNAAGNLILDADGGPAAVTAFVRTLGDTVTRLDRHEPKLNDHDGDLDTTSPRAMVLSLRQLLLGDALAPASRDQLQQWMRATVTGGARLKAGLPAGWQIGDKTGTGDDTSADVGIVWPPGRAPLLVAAYLSRTRASSAVRDAALAQVGALLPLIASEVAPR